MSVGINIRRIRNQKGMTQKQLGEACGIAEPTIRRYELGMLNPKYSTLKKIADGLGVEVMKLIDSDDPEEKYRFDTAEDIFNFVIRATRNEPVPTKETEKLERLIAIYNRLDDNGQEKVIEYAKDLVGNSRYQKKGR